MSLRYEICESCGGFYEKKDSKQTKCPKCQRKAVRERQKIYNKKRKKPKPVPQEEKSICKKVKSCKYGARVGSLYVCDYLGVKGHSRGCPVEGCTKYERGRKK